MNRLLLALLVCAACKHSSSASSTSHTETSTVTDSTSSESGAVTTTTTVTEQPGTTTTTVSEYGPTEGGEAPAEPVATAPGEVRVSGLPSDTQGVVKRPRHGPLVKRTVTVTRSGGETTQTRQEATSQGATATETKAAGKVDTQAQAQEASAPSASCVGASWIWGLAVLVGVGGIVYFAVRLRKAVP